MDPASTALVANKLSEAIKIDDPNSKVDDNLLMAVVKRYGDKLPQEALLAVYGTVKQLAQNSVDISKLPSGDAPERIKEILKQHGLVSQSHIEVAKTKDTKSLDVIAQNIDKFLQTEYQLQGRKAESEVGLDTTARSGVASATSTFGWLGTMICKITDALGMERFDWAQQWVNDAETYTAKKIQSGAITRQKTNVSELQNLSMEKYGELVGIVGDYVVDGQRYVPDVAKRAAGQTQEVGKAAVAAGTLQLNANKPEPTAKPAVPQVKVDLNKFGENADELGKPWYKKIFSPFFSDNSADVAVPKAAQVKTPSVQLDLAPR